MDSNSPCLKRLSIASVVLGAVVLVWGAICGVAVGFDDARPFFVLLCGVAGALYGYLVLRAVNEGAGLYTLKENGRLMARSRLYAHRHLHRARGSLSCACCPYCRKPRCLGAP